jgi:hypothetical protein
MFYVIENFITRISKRSMNFQIYRKITTVKLGLKAAGNIREELQHVVKVDVMLSPDTTSLEIISIGRGRIPFLGPIFWKSIGPRQGRVGSSKALPEKHKTSKAEYTNTQQGLPGIGYTLAHN